MTSDRLAATRSGQGDLAGSRLRAASRRLILDQLGGVDALAQSELARRTGLSRTTVASVISELAAEGRVQRLEGVPAGRGRPPQLLQLRPQQGVAAALDLGHSHLSIALTDLSGTILAERRAALNVGASATVAIDFATDMLTALLDELPTRQRPDDLRSIVIGVPGPIDGHTGALRSGTILPGWVGMQPADEFAARLGRPVVLDNDANLGAIGELRYGRARGIRNLLYVKVSTGIGAGMVLEGKLYRGTRGTAGEIGHVQVSEDGALCRCGSRGCLETQASAEAALGVLSAAHGRAVTMDEALEIVRAGDPGAVRLFTDMGTAIGRVVAAVSANLDPELVVVGGPLVDDPGPLLDGFTAAVHRYTQPYVSSNLKVAGGVLGERAGLLGAIAMAVQAASAD
ncbi:ROK family protein [Nakamurella aerolata]|uniref:ROK family transcriptional regulator n=1 Tax=Nakamurella aerolata TaxID=1656892 RepID=A0A849A9W1_9ACTN|nr:ROK family transcriptional regulator [Nakamurella aerolata]